MEALKYFDIKTDQWYYYKSTPLVADVTGFGHTHRPSTIFFLST